MPVLLQSEYVLFSISSYQLQYLEIIEKMKIVIKDPNNIPVEITAIRIKI